MLRQSASQQDQIHRQRNDKDSRKEVDKWRSQPDSHLFSHQSHGAEDSLIKFNYVLLHESLLHEIRFLGQRSFRTFQIRHHQHHFGLLLPDNVPKTSTHDNIQLNPVIG